MIGVNLNLAENFAATAIMTVVSLARSYIIRRAFVWIHGCRPSKLDEACAILRTNLWRIPEHGHKRHKRLIEEFLEGVGK
jgi:hypothetical protein